MLWSKRAAAGWFAEASGCADHERTRMRWSKRQRHGIFEWLTEHSESMVNRMDSDAQQNRQRARSAAPLTRFRRPGLIKLSQTTKTVSPFSNSTISSLGWLFRSAISKAWWQPLLSNE